MRLFVLTTLTMVAFAANSVLTRAGVAGAGLSVELFGLIRLASGALILLGLCLATGRRVALFSLRRAASVLGLVLYIIGFTYAYLGMDAGLGALVLFGTVQVTMFAGAVLLREALPALRALGAVMALAGLIYLVWPWQEIAQSQIALAMMVVAGLGWGLYSLVGKGSADPLADTAANFLLASVALPLIFLAMGSAPIATEQVLAGGRGVWLAVASGAVASGLGYALWYRVLPELPSSVAAVVQLTVPPIALLGGVVFLGEALTAKFAIAALVILGGVALSVLGPRYLTMASRGS
ncbi:DMT family transporter [Tropicibacter oceani]|uniref:DMT family transporter n=1 Tax=Tropicibacter oceani TaxID=3058420 RepID=A0ABY8QK97_9RHOB|nr:DMT family transporter [Tropicibacter oceani]WGW04242.1 DMT family transporter [Tropicibacter oceani]